MITTTKTPKFVIMVGLCFYIFRIFRPMPQPSNFQHEAIVLFREEHPTWGLQKCWKILPEFFGAITNDQFRGVTAAFKQGGSPVAKVRKHCSGTSCKHDSLTRRAVLELAVTPPDHRRRHLSQRETC